MIYLNCDYAEGAHESILAALAAAGGEQNPGYGQDGHCRRAAQAIRTLCEAPNADVHFLVGGTQANMTVIAAAQTGHINGHETGAVEATGHKVLALAHTDGKITAAQVDEAWREQAENEAAEHLVQPKMVYISHPTELGTLYTRAELEATRWPPRGRTSTCPRWRALPTCSTSAAPRWARCSARPSSSSTTR